MDELQGEPEEITKAKAKQAAKQIGPEKLALVEDTCLCLDALGGLPGPYVKHFIKRVGCEGLTRMLKGFESDGAMALCVFAFCRDGEEPGCVTGKARGKIVEPRGASSFGWDPIFEPHEGDGSTFAEMADESKNAISHRGKALETLRQRLQSEAYI